MTHDNYLKKELYELIKKDESIFDFIQEASIDGLWYWDLENPENEWMNPKFWTVIGYNPSEMPHKSEAWQNIINPDDLKLALDNFTKHCENPNHPYDQIVRYTHKNGSTVWIRCRGMAIRDNSGKPIRMLGAHHDITNIKIAENELLRAKEKVEETEYKFKTYTVQSPISIYVADKNGDCIFVNECWLQMSGMTFDEALGNGWINALHPDDKATISDKWYHSVKSNGKWSFEYRFIDKVGNVTWVEGTAKEIFNKKNELIGFLGSNVDITDRKKAEYELKKAKEKTEESENTFRKLFEGSSDAILLIDKTDVFVECNQAALDKLKMTREQFLFKSPIDISPEYQADGQRSDKKALEMIELAYQKGLNRFDWICVDSDGEKFIVEVSLMPIKVKGELMLYTSWRDISDRIKQEKELKLAKEKIEESEIKYRSLFINMMNAFGLHEMIFNDKGEPIDYVFLEVNPVWEKVVGIKAQTVIGKRIKEIMPNIEQTWIDRYGRVVLTGIPEEFIDYNAATKKYYNVFAYKHLGNKFAVVFNDVTEKKQFEEELIKSKEKAEESDRLKTAFLQNMSHEIRTPMNAIMGFSSLLSNNFNDKSKLEHFSKIIDLRCNDLLDIINDVLDISKIESGQSTINIENCNLNKLFDELTVFFNDYKVRINKSDINLKFHYHSDKSVYCIKTDKLKIKQILTNLIGNALKFTVKGSVECGYTLENGKLQFFVNDTGIGIPSEMFEPIFDRFIQLKHPSIRNVGGTGLGLPIVKGLVKQLGGNVWLSSEYNKGSTFYFTIDYIKVDLDILKNSDKGFKQQIFTDKTILIVEDDYYNLEYLKEILKDVSLNIIEVANGLSAVKAVQEQKIDLILMDIRLPDITGYEASRLILQNNPHMKIIAQTAYAANTEHQKAIEAGCVDYISKPTKQEQLLMLLWKYLK